MQQEVGKHEQQEKWKAVNFTKMVNFIKKKHVNIYE